jgi:hypothetical protein
VCVSSFTQANIQRPQVKEAERKKKVGKGTVARRVRRGKVSSKGNFRLWVSGSVIIYIIRRCRYLQSEERTRKHDAWPHVTAKIPKMYSKLP